MVKHILGITLLLSIFSLSAYARMEVRIPVPGLSMDSCIIDGGEYRESDNYYACCTGPTECIVCEKGGGGSCQFVSVSKLNSLGLIKGKAPSSVGNFNAPSPKPPSLRDQMKKRKAPASIPAKIVNPAKAPTVNPIKEHKQIKSPTKASQTMGK